MIKSKASPWENCNFAIRTSAAHILLHPVHTDVLLGQLVVF